MIKYEIWPTRSVGGQHVGTGPNGIKATHWIGEYPSGLEAFCDCHRSQHKNKECAREMIHWGMASCKMEITPDD